MAEKKDPKKSPKDTNGPVVKTGPTSGQNRSRNSDGAWRAKRSDAGKSRKWNLKRDKKVYLLSLSFFIACDFKGDKSPFFLSRYYCK